MHTSGGTAPVVYVDLSDREREHTNVLFPNALAAFNRIHILVHAAGIQRRAPAVQCPDEAWDEVRPQPIFLFY